MARTSSSEPTGQGHPTRAPRPDRPDPRPARLMMGAGALAAVSVMGAGLVHFPSAPAVAEGTPTSRSPADAPKVGQVKRAVEYVRLKPGQKAPKGAKVIKEAAPTPRVVVRRVVVSAPSRPARIVTRTRQSGR
jgi:hypothetical protein